MQNNPLFQQLRQQITQWQQGFESRLHQKVFAKFDRSLFSDDFETLDFYFNEINQALAEFARLPSDAELESQYLSEKIINQCRVLQDALNTKKTPPMADVAQAKSAREQRRQAIHNLPPRERLAEYYVALNKLNLLIEKYQDALANSRDTQQRTQAEQLLIQTEQRRAKALFYIENLEEYLSSLEDE